MTAPKAGGKQLLKEIDAFRKNLLKWYDRHRRVLPWRAPAGTKSNPYHVWLSEIMLQQTVVAAVVPYFLKFIETWPRVEDLAAAAPEDVTGAWAGLGYYARARNLHRCAKAIVSDFKGEFPADRALLKTLPGIGEYTSGAIAAIAFDLPAAAMDGNVERVLARYFNVTTPLPDAKKELRVFADDLTRNRSDRPGDFAQAMMDLGATVCIPKSPRCGVCPLREACRAQKAGNAVELPVRREKKPKPKRQGFFYWIVSDQGRVLLHRRPEKGLLGGMIGVPVSAWEEREPDHLPLALKLGQTLAPDRKFLVTHTFTHFDLKMRGCRISGIKEANVRDGGYYWAAPGDVQLSDMPTVFKKAARLMIE